MNLVIAPIAPAESGAAVANLQDTLLALLERNIILALVAPNRPTADELATLATAIKRERQPSLFGESTRILVSYFQVQQGLGDHLRGVVEDTTAAKLNEHLKALGLLGVVDPDGFIVRGTVTDGQGGFVPRVVVRAFDRDMRKEQALGKDAVTDDRGQYLIRYRPEDFASGDVPDALTPRLIVRAFVLDQQIGSDVVRRTPLREEVVDFEVATPGVSEWEMLSAAVIPLLAGQGKGNRALPPWDLNDRDLSFIEEETGVEKEKVRLWALAFAVGRDAKLVVQAPGVIGTRQTVIGVLPDPITADDLLPFAIFYGWFRRGLTGDWPALQTQQTSALRGALIEAMVQGIVPIGLRDYVDSLLALVPNAPAKALESVLGAAALPRDAMNTVLAQADGIETVSHELLVQMVEQNTLAPDQAKAVGLGVSLHRLAGGDASVVSTMIESSFPSLNAGKLTQAQDLALLEPAEWEQALEKSAAPLPDGVSRPAYARALAMNSAAAYPDTAFRQAARRTPAKLDEQLKKARTLVDRQPNALALDFDALDLGRMSRDEREALRETHTALKEFANVHPGLGLHDVFATGGVKAAKMTEERIGWLNTVFDLNPDMPFADLDYLPGSLDVPGINFGTLNDEAKGRILADLKVHQRVHSVTDNAISAQELMKAGFHSASAIAVTREADFVAGSGLPEPEAKAYHAKAVERGNSAAVNWFGIYDVLRDQATTPVQAIPSRSEFFKSLQGAAELINNEPWCECDKCQSVLSPAAYFVDLMYYVEQHILKDSFVAPTQHVLHLQKRRPDLWELPLTCQNTTEYVAYLDVVNEVLERYLKDVASLGDAAAVYKHLAEQERSFTQPFNLPLERLDTLLGHFGASRSDVAKTLGAAADIAVRARLKISRKAYDLMITDRSGDGPFLWTLFKLAGAPTVTTPDAALPPLEMATLLEVTALTHDVAQAVFTSAFVNVDGSNNAPVVSVLGKRNPTDVQNNTEVVNHLSLRRLDRIHRFVRLARTLSWNATELDYVLGRVGGLNAAGLGRLVTLLDFGETWALPVDEVMALSDEFSPKGLRDLTPLFDRLFNDPSVVVRDGRWPPPAGSRFTHPSWDPSTGVSNPTNNTHARLLAGLQLSDAEFLVLVAGLGGLAALGHRAATAQDHESISLSGAAIAALYRHARVMRLLKSSAADFVKILRLTPRKTTLPTDAARYINDLEDVGDVIQFAARQKTTGFSLDEVTFLTVANAPRPEDDIDPSALASQIIANVREEKTLEFADTILAQVGLTESQSRNVVLDNLSVTGTPKAFEALPDGQGYRLTAGFTAAITTTPAVDADLLRALLGKYDAIRVLDVALGAVLVLSPEEVRELRRIADPLAPADVAAVSRAIQGAGSTQDKARLTKLIGESVRYHSLFTSTVFDVAALRFVADNPVVFGLSADPAQRTITTDVVRRVAAYVALATPTDVGFTTASGAPDIEAIQAVVKGVGAATPQQLARALRTDEAAIGVLTPHLPALPSNPFDALDLMARCLQLAKRIGVSAETLKLIVTEAPTPAGTFDALSRAAEDMLSAFRARYGTETLVQEKLEPYEDQLRSRKRDGLVDYIVTRWHEPFANASKLYEYFLIDVMFEGCARTSRLVAAISSVQLYVHRVLMNLERSADWDGLVPPKAGIYARFTDAAKRSEWQWREHYRVWEANRKVFLYPENYIEPELRDDKTPLFIDLEDTLLLQEISPSSVHDAYARYLSGFDELAHLKIAGAYYDATTLTLHLFGVTQDEAPVYYYREVSESASGGPSTAAPRYSAWQKLNLQIPVRKVSPIICEGRLYVFWLETATRPINSFEGGFSRFTGYRHTVRVKYSTLRLDGGWTPPKIVSFVESGGTSQSRIVEDPLDLDVKIRIETNLAQAEADLEKAEPARADAEGKARTANDNARIARDGRIGKQGTLNNWLDAVLHGVPFAEIGAGVAYIDLQIAIGNENDKNELARAANDLLTRTTNTVRSLTETIASLKTELNSIKVLVRWDHSLRDHNLALDSYKPEGWEWDRVYPDVRMGANGRQGIRLMLVPRTLPVPSRNVLELKSNDFDENPAILRDMPAAEQTTVGMNPRPHWSAGILQYVIPLFPTQKNNSQLATQQWVGAMAKFSAENSAYAGQGFYAATFWLNQPAVTGSAAASAPATSDIQIVNGAMDSVILESQGDSVWMRKRAGAPYAGTRLGTKLTPTLINEFWRDGANSLLDAAFQQDELVELRSEISPVAGQGEAARENPFHPENPCLTYFRETFFHIPFLIANHLNSQQQFSETQRWYHYLFDPTAATGDRWRYREFRELPSLAPSLRSMLTSGDALAAYRNNPFSPHAIARTRFSAYQKSIVMKYIDNLMDWADSLFSQFTMESINEATMLYVMAQDILGPRPQNLGSCGNGNVSPRNYETIRKGLTNVSDFLVELEPPPTKKTHVGAGADTGGPVKLVIDTGLATAHAATVAAVPEPVLPPAVVQTPRAARELKSGSGNYWTNVSGTPMESVRLGSAPATTAGNIDFINRDTGISAGTIGTRGGDRLKPFGQIEKKKRDLTLDLSEDLSDFHWAGDRPVKHIRQPEVDPVALVPPKDTVFCIPPNADLLAYWGRVEDRLFKIRNCMDISGVRRRVDLFAPEIDPRLLVRMKAAGLSLDDVLNSTSGNLPPYRFTYLIDKAKQYAGTVQSFGAQLLGALEKRDGEELSHLRAVHEQNLLKMRTKLTFMEIQAAEDALESLRRQKAAVEYRQEHFRSLTEAGQNASERKQQQLQREAAGFRTEAGIAQVVASLLTIIPDVGAPTSMKFGGSQIGASGRALAEGLNAVASFTEMGASMAGVEASNQRRSEEWKHQIETATREIGQVDKNITAAEIKRDMATHALEVHEQTINQTEEMFEFFRDKFSSIDRYRLLSNELRRVYRLGFNAALSMAKMAEQAFRAERTDADIALGGQYWDADNAGLLAGERLLVDLQRLEQEYIESNYRQLEVEQAFSVAQFAPQELLTLRLTGECRFAIPEWFFDLSYPGQYRRRLKAVRLTVPCVTGPYGNVGATLRLENSSIRLSAPGITDVSPLPDLTSVPLRHTTAMATSKAQYDAGVFDFSFRDERYMPFEGAGAVGTWQLSLPKTVRVFDYETISDVILHLSYTADFSEGLKTRWDGAAQELITLLSTNDPATSAPRLMRSFSLRNEFPEAFHQIVTSRVNTEVTVAIDKRQFPLFLGGRALRAANASVRLISPLSSLTGATVAIGQKIPGQAATLFREVNAPSVASAGTTRGLKQFDCGDVLASIATATQPARPGVLPMFFGDQILKITSAGPLASTLPGANGTIDPQNLQDIVLRIGYVLG